ncbi:MAG: hypothetical protein HYZ48_03400 [Chlamydiales bacterium]|nr:hypothetical protein [Chlamydiales bacterium]
MIHCLFLILGFLSFFSNPLIADLIDNIEFQFPVYQDWNLSKQINNSCGSSLLYSPEDTPYDYDTEMFCAQFFQVPYFYLAPETFKDWFQIASPLADLRFNTIASDNNSTLMELYALDDGDLQFYALIRSISSENGTVVLSYTVEDPTNLSTIKSAWVPLLLTAKAL